MNKRFFKQVLCIVLALVLMMALAACGEAETGEPELITVTDGEVIGEGATEFPLTIVDAEGKSLQITVKTDAETVGAALVDLGVIAGEDSEYGLYVKTVNGTTLDYEQDGKYWSFYINGEYAMTGVDATAIEAGTSYELKAE